MTNRMFKYCTVDGDLATYSIKTGPKHYSVAVRPWMRLASTITVDCRTVGATCSYRAITCNPAELEDALDADTDVIAYEVVS